MSFWQWKDVNSVRPYVIIVTRVLRKRITTKFWSPIGLYYVNCTRFGQLILRKIIKIVATRCQIFSLKCIKIDFVLLICLDGRHSLRLSSSHRLQVPAYRLSTVGRRSIQVAASILWNSLPPDIQSSASLTDFSHKLKTYMLSSLIDNYVFTRSCTPSFNYRPSFTLCRCTYHLELPTRWRSVINFPATLPSSIKDISIRKILPRCYSVFSFLSAPSWSLW